MKRLTNDWSADAVSKMVKMFGESVIELTSKYSIASHRHRSLSTTAKARELSRAIGDVKSRVLPKPSLKPMIEEFSDSISGDPVVLSILVKKDIPIGSLSISERNSLEGMSASIRIYLDLIAPLYSKEAEDLILSACVSGKKAKGTLRLLADLYVSHLVGNLTSRDILHIIAKREFSIVDIADPLDALRSFFSELSTRSSTYDVMISASEQVCDYLSTSLMPEVFKNRDDLPPWFRLSCFGKAGVKSKGPFIVLKSFPGADAFSVARNAKYLLDMLHSFLFVFPDGTRWESPDFANVYDPLSGGVYRVSMFDFINEGSIIRSKKAHRELIQQMAAFAFGRNTTKGTHSGVKIASALQAASAASRVLESDARLLSIWSAFEAILPHPLKDGEGTVRINHFADYIAPLATAGYTNGLFRSLFVDLGKNYTKDFLSYIDKEGAGSNRFDKFISVFYLAPHKKMAFTNIFSDSEMLLHRAHDLDQIANDCVNLRTRIQNHERRVAWQLHRIYRARNMIVHSARSANYIPQLTENAFSYFKEMTSLLVKAGGKYSLSNSDALFDLCLSLCKEKSERLSQTADPRKALDLAIKSIV